MACDESIMSCANQNEQLFTSGAEQENESSDSAQNVEDKSSRNEELQNKLDAAQRSDVNKPRMCEDDFYHLQKRNLPNSAVVDFLVGSFESSYKLPTDDATFGSSQKPFDVKYVPSKNKLYIEMPVKFMGATDLHSVSSKIPSGRMSVNLRNDSVAGNFKAMYKQGVNRAWSGQFQFYLNAKNPVSNSSCCGWSCVNPVDVVVSVRDVDLSGDSVMSHPNSSNCYKIYYYIPPRGEAFRNVTSANWVIFSEKTRACEANERNDCKQNVFAHEFGHQLGFDDEYPVDYIKDEIRGEKKCVYRNAHLKAYERTEGDREYTLPREKFNHGGESYSAVENVFIVDKRDGNGNVNKIEKNGVFLKRRKWYGEVEENVRLDGLRSPSPISAVDINGNRHRAVYLFEDGKQEVILKAREKAGVRVYDLEYLSNNRTNGARIYHNGKKYSVGKISKRNRDGSEKVYYYLVNEDGSIRKNYLDGMYTSHTEMAKKEFDLDNPEYANKNATMYDKAENTSQGLEKNLMNGGDTFKPHYYIPFKRGMVNAIRSKHWLKPSPFAPNMEEDWTIE